jgi:hypothetical protein
LRIVSKRQAVATLLLTLAVASGVACGGGKTTDPNAASPKASTTKDAHDAGPSGTGGDSPAAGGPAETKPFAGSPQEATALIGAAIDKKAVEIQKCVAEYRARKKMPHDRVSISMGIDQEGRLLGATLPKGKTDAPLSECVLAALANAAFPRSHSGVISITKSYEEIVQ